MVISKKYVFLLVNFLMMTGIMFSVTDFFLADLGAKFKFVFILYCLVDILSHKERPCSRNLAVVFSLLFLYVVVWGFIFKNPIVAVEIAQHDMRRFFHCTGCTVYTDRGSERIHIRHRAADR